MNYQEETKAFRSLVLEVANHLPGWHVDDLQFNDRAYNLIQDDGSGCLAVFNIGDKIKVCGCMNRIHNTRGEVTTSYMNNQMKASKIKGPAKLAQDIIRRILPNYLVQVKDAEDIVKHWNLQIEKQNATATRLAKIMGIKAEQDCRGRLSLYREHQRDEEFNIVCPGLSINVEISEGDYGVEIKASYLRPEEAEAAIQVILETRKHSK